MMDLRHRNLRVMRTRARLTFLLQGLMFFTFTWLFLKNTNIALERPYSIQPLTAYTCEEDFGYSNISLGDIQSGTHKPYSEQNQKYILNANKTCLARSEVLLLILVKSAVGNFKKRRIVRETWGKDAEKRGFKLVFLLGYNTNNDIFVNYEKTIFDDLIQYNFEDTYENNTTKIKMALLWILKFCSQAKYIALVDDDMYVNIPNTIGFIRRAGKDEYLYSGFLIDKPRPIRNPSNKSLYLEPVSRGLNPKSRPAEGPNSVDAKAASTPKRGSVEIPSSSTSHQSEIYNTLDTGNDQQNYTELTVKHQYEDLHDGMEKGNTSYEKLTDKIYMQNIQNKQLNNTENPKQNRFLYEMIICCAVTSLIINCPVGIFSVCYACMARRERFLPMKRYYLFMTFVVASLAGVLFAIICTLFIIPVILMRY